MQMDFFDGLTMLGGLALFLYGMNLMSSGLSLMAGGRLERILARLTGTPLKAVLAGAGVTAVIQSSSAATVMVVGFVNSGIMKLEQAVGVIMGANVGTTVTAWILAAAGTEGSSFPANLLDPASFSSIPAIMGVAFLMLSKKEKTKNLSAVLMGFGILMSGMDTMSRAVKPLASMPWFTGMLTRFSHPAAGMLAGLVLTALIQSSSASVGILQALCTTGAVPLGAAIPIIMGQNIGTCVTAILSGIGASKDAGRAALVHLYFNVAGTIVFMSAFYLLHGIRPFRFLKAAADSFDIALIHSIFNVASVFVMLPFVKLLVAAWRIRDR